MIVYLILLAALVASVLIPLADQKKRDIRFIVLSAILFLLSAFRKGIGTDFVSYQQYYQGLLNGVIPAADFELGYYLLNHILAYFGCHYQLLFILTSAAIVGLVCVTIKKYSQNPELSLLLYVALYFYFSSYNIVRQHIAIACIFFAVRYLMDKQVWKYMLWVLIASLFHRSVLIMVPLYFLLNLKIPVKFRWVIIGAGVLGALFGRQLLSMLLRLVPKYSIYAEFEAGSAWCDLAVIVMNLILLHISASTPKREEKTNLFINASLFSFLFAALAFCNVLFARIYPYMHILSVLSIPYAITGVPKGKRKLLLIAVSVVACVVCLYYFIGNNGQVVPYQITDFK